MGDVQSGEQNTDMTTTWCWTHIQLTTKAHNLSIDLSQIIFSCVVSFCDTVQRWFSLHWSAQAENILFQPPRETTCIPHRMNNMLCDLTAERALPSLSCDVSEPGWEVWGHLTWCSVTHTVLKGCPCQSTSCQYSGHWLVTS